MVGVVSSSKSSHSLAPVSQPDVFHGKRYFFLKIIFNAHNLLLAGIKGSSFPWQASSKVSFLADKGKAERRYHLLGRTPCMGEDWSLQQ
jgi:hypothetical protein